MWERSIGSLISHVFWGTHGHRKWAFFSFNTVCLDTTNFVLLRVFTLKETICPKICRNSRPKSAKRQLPVYVRRSKKINSLLEREMVTVPVDVLFKIHVSLASHFTYLFIYLFNPRNPNITIQFLICCPYRFPMKVVETSCWIRFIFCDHVLNSRDHSVLKKKLDAGHLFIYLLIFCTKCNLWSTISPTRKHGPV